MSYKRDPEACRKCRDRNAKRKHPQPLPCRQCWTFKPDDRRHEAARNTKPRHWRVDPETHKLEEVQG